ncbi:hypothetical protein GF325_12205 [Candidatus Bathyarchaeota archaeon]|nr:hypothetical protein [Candidatus Bathyarchaeota archaeon]
MVARDACVAVHAVPRASVTRVAVERVPGIQDRDMIPIQGGGSFFTRYLQDTFMRRNTFVACFSAIAGFFILSMMIASPARCQVPGLSSTWADNEPTIDGQFTGNEWDDAMHVEFFHDDPTPPHLPDDVHIYMKNTKNKWYILIDDLPDNTSEENDHVGLFFDCDQDGSTDDQLSMMLYRNETISKTVEPGWVLANWEFGFSSSPNKGETHSILEIEINITMDIEYNGTATAGDLNYQLPVGLENRTIKMMFYAGPLFCGWEYPDEADMDKPTEYFYLTFATKTSGIPGYLALGTVTFIAFAAVIFKKRAKTC